MSPKPLLYYTPMSPPSRSVLLTAAALDLELELKDIKISEGEHLEPEFLKMNPQHTLPFLDDDGVGIADSHAICMYLCDKYAADDNLYPKDLVKRSLVNSRLHFNSGHLFCHLRFLFEPILLYNSPELPQGKIDKIQLQWAILEGFLENNLYLCGEEMTIADLCCIATVTSLNEIVTIDPEKHPQLTQWVERMAELPYFEEKCGAGSRAIQAAIIQLRQQNADAAE